MNKGKTDGLSILIPAYNHDCTRLVSELAMQLRMLKSTVKDMECEIVVIDDGSTDSGILLSNRRIGSMDFCRYIENGHNIGRAAIRNQLAAEARYEWLVFLDCDVVVLRPDFVQSYYGMRHIADVVVGALRFSDSSGRYADNLRYRYESRYVRKHVQRRNRQTAYTAFRTTNFMIRRSVIISHPFDESFEGYGYEDTLFGKELKDVGVSLTHADIDVTIDEYDTNAAFVEKTEESLRTLSAHADQMEGFSKLLAVWHTMTRWRFTCLSRPLLKPLLPVIRHQLVSNTPSLLLYDIYKLAFFISIHRGQ